MIILDIETTGLNPSENGIVSIGALYFYNPKKQFYGECRIDEDDIITGAALRINGFSVDEIKSKEKQTQKELLEKFFKWVDEQEIKMLAGHNVGFFDLNFLKTKATKYNLRFKTRYRSFDLCSVAQTRYHQIHDKFLLDNYKENAMNLSNILKFCEIKDERLRMQDGRIVQEGKAHNALEDCKLEAECFSRLLFGRGTFPEYNKFPIPPYLTKED